MIHTIILELLIICYFVLVFSPTAIPKEPIRSDNPLQLIQTNTCFSENQHQNDHMKVNNNENILTESINIQVTVRKRLI